KANNHFGIKCHLDWDGTSFIMDDDRANECFRKYKSPMDSYQDHSVFLTTRTRYSDLFDLKILDYKGWAKGLKKAGYATNPKYPELLVKIIEEHELYKFDKKVADGNFVYRPVNRTSKEVAYKPRSRNKEDFKPLYIGPGNREIYENNRTKYIYAKRGDTFYKIAQDFAIYTWQIYKYNDLKKNNAVHEDQIIYLERKKNKGTNAFHIVQKNESMYDISQLHGVKLKKLYKYNNMAPGHEPGAGQKIKLRK
ncbi:MAG: LysM peptidoglycan-binding domain-containing protein, partial [Bacteroidales bacterium]|nr:LysM peptidoglycan-binding domain-containing protein [Bacteroidales bacterium]